MKKMFMKAMMIMAMVSFTTSVSAQDVVDKKAKKECCDKKEAKAKDCKKCNQCKSDCAEKGCKECANNHQCDKSCKK